MLLTHDSDTVEASGLGAVNQFTIAASPKAFEILSSNLYQNKVLAVIREITCNAVDAHTEAGLPISDIQVHLPTYEEPHFSVRDFGAGLSQSDVMELYTTYFRSTKDKSNALIGGFGLGSKSPFAVADQFTVTSWHNGTKSTYICFKEGGLPRVSVVNSEPSDEPSGIEVMVSSAANARWHDEAASFFRYWPVLPTFNRSTFIEPVLHPDNIIAHSTTSHNGMPDWAILKMGKPVVMMGLVPYQLDILQLASSLPRELYTLLTGARLFLNVPVGTFEISPSRETLSYDAATITKLSNLLVTVGKAVMQDLLDQLKECATLYEARIFVFGNGSVTEGPMHALQELVRKGTVTWRGNRIHQRAAFPFRAIFGETASHVLLSKPSHRKTMVKVAADPDTFHMRIIPGYDMSDHKQHIVWTASRTPKLSRKLFYHFVGTPDTDRTDFVAEHTFFILSGMPFDDLVKQCRELGFEPPINGDELEDVPSDSLPRGTRATTKGYTISFIDHKLIYTSSTANLDLKGGGLYIPFVNGSPAFDVPDIRILLSILSRCYLSPVEGIQVIGIAAARLKSPRLQKELAANGWSCLDTKWMQANVDIPAIKQNYARAAFHNYLRDKFWRTGHVDFLNRGRAAYVQGKPWKGSEPFFSRLEALATQHSMDFNTVVWHLHRDVASSVLRPDQITAIYQDTTTNMAALLNAYQAFIDCHPMLGYCGIADLPSHIFLDYINR